MVIKIKLLRHFSTLASSGFGAYYLFNDIYRLDNLKTKLELKIDDNTIKVPDKINNLLSEVMTDMKIKDEDKIRIKPFITKITDTFHLGSLGSKTGPYVGIPFHFSVDEADNVAYTVWVDQVRIPQDAPETKTLKQSVILSEQAKKFAIAREVYRLIYSNAATRSLLPLVVVLNFCMCSVILEKIGKASVKYSVKPHAVLLLSGICIYILMLNVLAFYTDTEADLFVCNLGKSYVQGGLEYYEKMLQKNKGIKKLNNTTAFKDDGDFQPSIIKNPKVPIKKRLTYLNDINSKKKTNPTPWDYIFS